MTGEATARQHRAYSAEEQYSTVKCRGYNSGGSTRRAVLRCTTMHRPGYSATGLGTARWLYGAEVQYSGAHNVWVPDRHSVEDLAVDRQYLGIG